MVLLSLIYLFLYSYLFIYSFDLLYTYLPALIFTLFFFFILLACFYHVFIIYVHACAILGFLYFSPMTSTEIAVCSFLFLYFV